MTPFATGSISIGLHPPEGAQATDAVHALLAQAEAASSAGFDGVTVSEHHAGFPGYVPQPLLVVVQILERLARLWAAPAPMLLGLRSPRLVAEELAWVHASFPMRFGVAIAAGYARSDFEALGVDADDPAFSFPRRLAELRAALDVEGPLGADAAVRAWARSPAPVAVAAASPAAARRAAPDAGILIPSGTPTERLVAIRSAYTEAGGTGPVVLVQQVWLGQPPQSAIAELQHRYDRASTPGSRGFRASVLSGTPSHIVDALAAIAEAAGATVLNLRVHLPVVSADDVLAQVEALGIDVIPVLREQCWPNVEATT